MRAFIQYLSVALCIAPMALAQAPLSAIDWLTESINHPPEFQVPAGIAPLIETIPHEILVKKGLAPVSPDAIGLLSPDMTRFSADLWGGMQAAEIAELLTIFQNDGPPESQILFHRLLLAQANPAPDDTQNGLVLQARVKRLTSMGALDAAESLIGFATTDSPRIFQIKFSIAALTSRTTSVCKTLQDTPAISSDLSARIFCLARGGDWNAAAITLSLGAGIGAIDPAREELLMRFLDPEPFEGFPDPEASNPLNIMDFVLREAVVTPRPSGLTPLPYLYRDIGDRTPLRAKIEASERLLMAGTLPSNLLFAAYREGKSASSGGVWGRASAVQKLDAALVAGDPEQISRALTAAFIAFSDVGLLNTLADEYAATLVEIPFSTQFSEVRSMVLDLLHLASLFNASWANGADLNVEQQLAMAIVTRAPLTENQSDKAVIQAIIGGLTGELPDTPSAARMHEMLQIGQQGQAIIAALKLLSSGALADPESIRAGLYILGAADQSAPARRIAVQILLLPTGG